MRTVWPLALLATLSCSPTHLEHPPTQVAHGSVCRQDCPAAVPGTSGHAASATPAASAPRSEGVDTPDEAARANPAIDCSMPALPAGAIDVRVHGAKGNGKSDDTAAFQSAVDACPPDGTVFVPAGEYRIRLDARCDPFMKCGLRLKSRMTLLLDPGATLHALPSGDPGYAMVLIADATDVTIAGGRLVGDRDEHLGRSGQWGMGIDVLGSTRVRLVGIRVDEFWGDGIYLGPGSNDAPAQDVAVCKVSADHNRRQGMSIVHATNVVVERSSFTHTVGTAPQAGIDVEPDAGNRTEHILIRDCYFSGNCTGVDVADPAAAGSHTDCVLESSTVENSFCVGVQVNAGSGVVLRDNAIRLSAAFGVLLQGRDAVVLEHNVIDENVGGGIRITHPAQTGGALPYLLRENRILRNIGPGIEVDRVNGTTIIDNDVVANQDRGIWLRAAHDNSVTGNLVAENGSRHTPPAAQLEVLDAQRNRIEGNTIRGRASHVGWGVLLTGPGCSQNLVISNHLRGTGGDGAIEDEGRKSTVRGND